MGYKYYIQRHASGLVGNCMLWWRNNGCGYTCDLSEAEVFDGANEHFKRIVSDSSKYTAWEQEYTDACARRHVDIQGVNQDLKGVWVEPAEKDGGKQ